jgi:hypothetical protein
VILYPTLSQTARFSGSVVRVGCSEDPRQLCPAAEDGPTRCGSHSQAANGESFSTHLAAERDLRQLLIQIRSRVKNGLQHLALNRGMQEVRGKAALDSLPLEGWSSKGRAGLLGLPSELDQQVSELDAAVRTAFDEPPQALLMTQPGVGPVTALAFALTCSVRFPELWSSTSLANSGAHAPLQVKCALTQPSSLSRGTPVLEATGHRQ